MNHFKEVCKSFKSSMVHNKEKEADQEWETDIEMVNINSIQFNSNHSAIIAKMETSSNKVIITEPYKVYMGIDGNIITLYIYKKVFPRATVEQLVAKRNTNIKIKMYNWTTVTQLGISRVNIECNNKHKMCNFFVVPGNGQVSSGMPDIEILKILTIQCNIIGTEEVDKYTNCSTNRPVTHGAGSKQCCGKYKPRNW